MSSTGIPLIDIAPVLNGDAAGKRRVAAEVGEALPEHWILHHRRSRRPRGLGQGRP